MLVPETGIELGGRNEKRTLRIRPAANQAGKATITLRASDGIVDSIETLVLTVNAVNDAPTIGQLDGREIEEATVTGIIPVVIKDLETETESLALTATSDNSVLVPESGIVLGGSGGERTVVITPVSDQNGKARITLTVSDGTASTSEAFTLTVEEVNDAPTISKVDSQQIKEDMSTEPIEVTITDVETEAGALELSAASDTPLLVPDSNICLLYTSPSPRDRQKSRMPSSG